MLGTCGARLAVNQREALITPWADRGSSRIGVMELGGLTALGTVHPRSSCLPMVLEGCSPELGDSGQGGAREAEGTPLLIVTSMWQCHGPGGGGQWGRR